MILALQAEDMIQTVTFFSQVIDIHPITLTSKQYAHRWSGSLMAHMGNYMLHVLLVNLFLSLS